MKRKMLLSVIVALGMLTLSVQGVVVKTSSEWRDAVKSGGSSVSLTLGDDINLPGLKEYNLYNFSGKVCGNGYVLSGLYVSNAVGAVFQDVSPDVFGVASGCQFDGGSAAVLEACGCQFSNGGGYVLRALDCTFDKCAEMSVSVATNSSFSACSELSVESSDENCTYESCSGLVRKSFGGRFADLPELTVEHAYAGCEFTGAIKEVKTAEEVTFSNCAAIVSDKMSRSTVCACPGDVGSFHADEAEECVFTGCRQSEKTLVRMARTCLFSDCTVSDNMLVADARDSRFTRCSGTVNINLPSEDGIGAILGAGMRCTLEDCAIGGTITAASRMGGLVGDLVGTDNLITNCTVDVTFSAKGSFGGLAYLLKNCAVWACRVGGKVLSHDTTTSYPASAGLVYGATDVSVRTSVAALADATDGNRCLPQLHSAARVSVVGAYEHPSPLVRHAQDSQFANCVATVDVTDTTMPCGGFAWDVEACTLRNCRVTGTVSGSDHVGGFVGKLIGASNVLENCRADVAVSGTGGYVGGLVGETTGGAFSNCVTVGSATGTKAVGGLVGSASAGSVFCDCVSSCAVTGQQMVGGLFGQLEDGTKYVPCEVTKCGANGDVVGGGWTGGLVGSVDSCAFRDSAACGKVSERADLATDKTTGYDRFGGFAGSITESSAGGGLFENCVAVGAVSAKSSRNVGGFAGLINGNSKARTTLRRVAASGAVEGAHLVGGFTGNVYEADFSDCAAYGSVTAYGDVNGQCYAGAFTASYGNRATWTRCYAAGKVVAKVDGYFTYTGGIMPYNMLESMVPMVEATMKIPSTDCYWNLGTTGQRYSAVGTGLTAAKAAKSGSYSGWNFAKVWKIANGHPHLANAPSCLEIPAEPDPEPNPEPDPTPDPPDEPECCGISLDKTTVCFAGCSLGSGCAYVEESDTVTVTSTDAWTAEVTGDTGLSLASSGSAGTTCLTLRPGENLTGRERSWTVTFTAHGTCGNCQATLVVTQAPCTQCCLTLNGRSSVSKHMRACGGLRFVEVESSTDWSISEESIPSWVKFYRTSGTAGIRTLLFRVRPVADCAADGASSRAAAIVFKSTESFCDASAVLNVDQTIPSCGCTYLNVFSGDEERYSWTTNREAFELSLRIRSSSAWTVASDADWLVATAGENATLALTVSAAESDRKGTLAFTNGDGLSRTFIVVQTRETLVVDPADVLVSAAGGTSALQVRSSTGWTLSIPEDCRDWLEADVTAGSGDESVSLAVAANETSEERSGTLTFTAGEIVRTCEIFQLAGRAKLMVYGPEQISGGETGAFTCEFFTPTADPEEVSPTWSVSPAEAATITDKGELTVAESLLETTEATVTATYEKDGVVHTAACDVQLEPAPGPGVWRTDVAPTLELAAHNAKLIVVLGTKPATCGYCKILDPIVRHYEFLRWAKEQGVWLINAYTSDPCGDAVIDPYFYDLVRNYPTYADKIEYPTLAFVNPADTSRAIGVDVARKGRQIGEETYDGTVASLIRGVAHYLKKIHPLVGDLGEIVAATFPATTYDGYLYGESDGSVLGTIQIKAAKAKYTKKTGKTTTRLTICIQPAGEVKKVSISGDYDLDVGGEQTFATKQGRCVTVCLGANGMTGVFEGTVLEGVPNVFLLKDADSKAAATAADATYVGQWNIFAEEGCFTVSVAKKGKAKLAGTLADGSKVSASAQLLIGDGAASAPFVLPRQSLSFALWLTPGSDAVAPNVNGLTDALSGLGTGLTGSHAFQVDVPAISNALAAVGIRPFADFLPDGVKLTPNATGKKWIVANGKSGRIKYDAANDRAYDAANSENPAGLVLTYVSKTGTFTGTFKAYGLAKGKLKTYTAKVAGVLVDGQGYGFAVIPKVGSAKVNISEESSEMVEYATWTD